MCLSFLSLASSQESSLLTTKDKEAREKEIKELEAYFHEPKDMAPINNNNKPKQRSKLSLRQQQYKKLQEETVVYICLVAISGGVFIGLICLLGIYCIKDATEDKEAKQMEMIER